MSAQLNGNEIHRRSHVFQISESSQVGEARRFALVLCDELGFTETRCGRVAIVVNELANNLVRYARDGRIVMRSLTSGTESRSSVLNTTEQDSTGERSDAKRSVESEQSGIEIAAIDRGPGLDLSRVFQDGYSTGSTPGTGLGAVRRQSDVFDVYSHGDCGTVILSCIFSQSLQSHGATDSAASLVHGLGEDRTGMQSGFEIGAVGVPIDGETVSGDAWAVLVGDEVRVVVADGLGHGLNAHDASVAAIDSFQAHPASNLEQLMKTIHGNLKSTRGAAVFLLETRANVISFTGVGNIRALHQLAFKTRPLISQNGTAGVQMRSVRTLSQEWDQTGYLILHSDGITSRWDLMKYPGLFGRHPALIAQIIYRDHARGSDDASIVVLRRKL